MTIPFLGIFDDWALLAIRLVVGLIFIIHGVAKLKNLKGTGDWFQSIGFKPGRFWGTLVALVESIGGAMVFAGFFTQIITPFLAVIMAVATFWKIKSGQKLIGGYELDLALLVANLALFTLGGGGYGLDRILPFIPY